VIMERLLALRGAEPQIKSLDPRKEIVITEMLLSNRNGSLVCEGFDHYYLQGNFSGQLNDLRTASMVLYSPGISAGVGSGVSKATLERFCGTWRPAISEIVTVTKVMRQPSVCLLLQS
jgi:hypothetical protein